MRPSHQIRTLCGTFWPEYINANHQLRQQIFEQHYAQKKPMICTCKGSDDEPLISIRKVRGRLQAAHHPVHTYLHRDCARTRLTDCIADSTTPPPLPAVCREGSKVTYHLSAELLPLPNAGNDQTQPTTTTPGLLRTSPTYDSTSTTPRQNRLEPFGLLRNLIAEARLNIWSPKWQNSRTRGYCVRQIERALSKVNCPQLSGTLADYLTISPDLPVENPNRLANTFANDGRSSRSIVVGFLEEVRIQGEVVSISVCRGRKPINMAMGLWQAVRECGRNHLRLSHDISGTPQNPCMALFVVNENADGELSSETGTLHRFSQYLVPAESAPEADCADWLVESKRNFEKRFDSLPNGDYIPDFVLTDVQGNVVVEALGLLAFGEYRLRVKAKFGWYWANGYRPIPWTPNRRRPKLPMPTHAQAAA